MVKKMVRPYRHPTCPALTEGVDREQASKPTKWNPKKKNYKCLSVSFDGHCYLAIHESDHYRFNVTSLPTILCVISGVAMIDQEKNLRGCP
ncbi:hypothetical protein M0802_011735 [Mischocyttarus mexicanus]|nr:hypothetical protein M0802_011735 [Mischocyttarus mexicanus]